MKFWEQIQSINEIISDFDLHTIEIEGLGEFLHHPLLVCSKSIPENQAARIIQGKQRTIRAYLKPGTMNHALLMVERAYRMKTIKQWLRNGLFGDIQAPSRAGEFWQLVAEAWTDTEHKESDIIWKELIESDVPHRELMTSANARKLLDAMPKTIVVYRGVSAVDQVRAMSGGVLGYQWTLNRKTAEFFAKRFIQRKHQPFVMQAEIQKNLVIAYLVERGEDEIIVLPEDIRVLKLAILAV